MRKSPILAPSVLALAALAACAVVTMAAVPPRATCGADEPGVPAQGLSRSSAPAAQTYYVATDGEDVVPGGTSDHPWRTLQFAVDNVAAGDVILVRTGEYQGCRIENSGAAGAYITLQAEPGAAPRVTSPGPNNAHRSNIEVETWEGNGTVSYWVIAGFEVSGGPSWGIDMRGSDAAHSHHLVVRYNRVHDNGLGSVVHTGIFLAFVDDAVIEFNESYDNGEHGIYCSNSGDRPVVRGNALHGNAGCGLHMNGDASMGGDGVISDALVERNVVYANGTAGGAAINMDGVEDSVVRNNLLYGNHAGGIAIFQGDGAICSQANRVLNNTIVMPADGRWAVNIADAECVNNLLFNNILLTHHAWRGSIVIPSAGLAGFQSDYNVVADRFSADGDNTVITLAEWQGLGYDAHSFTSTTGLLFVNEAGADYRLLPAAPAVDAGTALPDVPDDLLGAPRPWGPAFDIGAYEYRELGFALSLPVVGRGWTR
jgi:parallel beta-helix repeat protein